MTEDKRYDDIDDPIIDRETADDEQEPTTATSGKEERQHHTDAPGTLKQVIEEHAREDEDAQSGNFTLRKILGGDILTADLLRRQIWLILLIVGFIIVYVANRYSCQKSLLELNRLNRELVDTKYKTLSLSSVLTERCRESHVVKLLRENNDTTLHISDQPPYIIDTSN